jgi:hypothetical protein
LEIPLSLQIVSAVITILVSFYLPGKSPIPKFCIIAKTARSCTNHTIDSDSPRALSRQGRIEEAEDVVDIEDPVKHTEATVGSPSTLKKADIGTIDAYHRTDS